MIQQSGMLTAYYLAILNWIQTGESVFNFDTYYGLCGNAYIFCGHDKYDAARLLVEEMQMQFEASGLNDLVPFNDPNIGDPPFRVEKFKYQNPKRLQWIKDHATI